MPLPIRALSSGESIDAPLLLLEMTRREKKDGSPYLSARLQDRSGAIDAVAWEIGHMDLDALTPPCIVRVRGQVTAWRDKVQLRVDALGRAEASHEELLALVPASAWSGELLLTQVEAHLDRVLREAPLRRLVFAALRHPDILARLTTTPAASHNHHAYRSGLVEHILSMLRLAERIGEHYQSYYPGRLHQGLLATGVVLHDIGKVWELEGDYSTSYSTSGKLLGHIFMAAAFIGRVADELGDIPPELVIEVQHLILSHHGELEFGSPKRPKTLEAMVLNQIDMLDARMNEWVHAMNAPGWTPWLRNHGRAVLQADELREGWRETPEAGDLPETGPGATRALPPEPQQEPARQQEPAPSQATQGAAEPAPRPDAPPRRTRTPKAAAAEGPEGIEPGSCAETLQLLLD